MGDGMTANAKLQLERENLAWLKEQCTESEKLTSGMVEILESFETRLGKLEQTILPVYQETGNLQRRQENIEKTLQELDHVINYYSVSKEVESVVREGPNGTTLQNFLDAMRKLKVALDYFSTNRLLDELCNDVRYQIHSVVIMEGAGFYEIFNLHLILKRIWNFQKANTFHPEI